MQSLSDLQSFSRCCLTSSQATQEHCRAMYYSCNKSMTLSQLILVRMNHGYVDGKPCMYEQYLITSSTILTQNLKSLVVGGLPTSKNVHPQHIFNHRINIHYICLGGQRATIQNHSHQFDLDYMTAVVIYVVFNPWVSNPLGLHIRYLYYAS